MPNRLSNPESLALCPWSALSAEQKAAVGALSITQEQVEYAGTVDAAIALCESKDENELAGLAILVKADAAGFLLLKRAGSAPDWVPNDAAVITALRVDAGHQGRGLGTAALRLVPDWVRGNWSAVTRLVLSVDEENASATRSYLKAGWSDDGFRIRGRIGWERRMTLELDKVE